MAAAAGSVLVSADGGNGPSAPPPPPPVPPPAVPCKGSRCPVPDVSAAAGAVDVDVTAKSRDAENKGLSDILVEVIEKEVVEVDVVVVADDDEKEDEEAENSCPGRSSVDPRPPVPALALSEWDGRSCVFGWMDGFGKIS